jgi:glutamyl-tRNA synthetase
MRKGISILEAGLGCGKEDAVIEQELCDLAASLGIKVNGVFMPIRVALTGSQVSLPLFDSIRLLGQEQTCERLEKALAYLEANSEV